MKIKNCYPLIYLKYYQNVNIKCRNTKKNYNIKIFKLEVKSQSREAQ